MSHPELNSFTIQRATLYTHFQLFANAARPYTYRIHCQSQARCDVAARFDLGPLFTNVVSQDQLAVSWIEFLQTAFEAIEESLVPAGFAA
jgi:hypothetical protein